MKQQPIRSTILFLLILLSVFCYGAGMMDYFAIYEPWKLIPANDFAAFHQYQGRRVVAIFVIPSAIMTFINVLAIAWPVHFIHRKWLWLSLAAYSFDWIFSFTMQIPIQLALENKKDMQLIQELLDTNWYRFAADTVQFVIISIVLWKLMQEAAKGGNAGS